MDGRAWRLSAAAALPLASEVMSDRATRVAMVEAAFRIANHRMAGWEERHDDDAPELYLCECGDRDCRAKIQLDRAAYEHVRSTPERFFVVPGHEIPDLEEICETRDEYLVLQKPSSLMEIVIATDPYSEGAGPARDEAESMADEIHADE
jgi:hypothetical protein